jgi:hypothetical protein
MLKLLLNESLKGRIVEPEETTIVRHQIDRHMSTAMDMHATIEELYEAAFSKWSVLRLWQVPSGNVSHG